MTKPPLKSDYKLVIHNKDHIELQLLGDWVIGKLLPDLKNVTNNLPALQSAQQFVISSDMLGKWDSRLVSFILLLTDYLAKKNIELDISSLPSGVQSLIQLATAVPIRKDALKTQYAPSIVEQIGSKALNTLSEVEKFVNFIGETWLSFIRFTRGKARFRKQDFWLIVQQCGPGALPIITLISLLMGLILAFMGAIQLRLFGADIYVANLVAIGMSREMGAMMTAIIMAGRTGAAFAAKLGTMQVNEEIDAFKTMGIAAMDFLVLPRVFALILMMPILTL